MECLCGSLHFVVLGQLGRRLHLRCEACGLDTSVLAADFPELNEDFA